MEKKKYLIIGILIVVVLFGVIFIEQKEGNKVEQEVLDAFETSEWVPVIVKLNEEDDAIRDSIISTLLESEFELKERTSGAFIGNITKEGLEKLELNEDVSKIEEETEEEESTDLPGTPVEKEPAPNWILDKSKEHIVSYVGENYYNEHISVKESWDKLKIDKNGEKYQIDYNYEFTIKGDSDETSLKFILYLDPNGDLVEYQGIEYRGPQKPYLFDIRREEALEIAKGEGLPESKIETGEEGGKTYNITKLTTARIEFGPNFKEIDESYIWYVSTENYESGKPTVVYVDVDSGEVLEIYIEESGMLEQQGVLNYLEEQGALA